MYRICLVLMVYFLVGACESPNPRTVNVDPSGRVGQADPFDRHGQLVLTRHAKCRMDCRHITQHEIHEILEGGNINYGKSEPDSHPDPKYAIEGYTTEHQHLRIIIAPEGDKLIVITCIELGVEWSCDCN